MAKLAKTRTEWEGEEHEEMTLIERKAPPPWNNNVEFKVIGRKIPRIDGPERVTGRAAYTQDLQLPGMLYARVLRSPYPHARIKSLDDSRAAGLPGVRAIVSYKNAPPISWSNDTAVLEPILRYAGDEVAAVAADDVDIAEDALKLIYVEYEKLPFVLSVDDALKPGAAAIHPGGNLVGGKPRHYERGDIKKGFSEADVIVEETFHTQSALHNCLESHGAVAAWNGDELTVWESTQSIYHVQDDLAEAFHLPRNKIRVICQFMGGGFGSKQYSGKWSILAAILSRRTERPVQLVYDRHEENLAAGNRSPTTQHIKIGAGKDGILKAIELQARIQIGAYGWGALSVEGPAQVLYECPNIQTEVMSIFTNTGPARSFRGPGYVEGNFPLESMIDELAQKLNIDPIEFRLKNCAHQDQVSGIPYSAKNLDQCYRRGAELIGWHRNNSFQQTSGAKRRAIGMASLIWGGGGGPPAYAWVRLNQDGTAEVITGSQDIGTGTRTVMAQIAAEELGLDINKVSVHLGDTAKGPYDPVSWGSMTVSSVGPAVRQAAIDARNQLRDICAGYLDIPANETIIRNGQVYVREEKTASHSLKDILEDIGDLTILGKGAREPNKTDKDVRTFGAQFADVEVDTLTGEASVLNMVTVHDNGRVMNPLGSQSQAEGALIQGIGYALFEGRLIDKKSGIVLNANMEDYFLPTALEFKHIGFDFVNKPDNQSNSLGAKGLGEPALIPTAPAIANALKRAIGVRFTSLPITRDKVLQALQEKGTAR